MNLKFYRCKHCGNIIVKVIDSTVPVVCCGEKMVELVPGEVDGAVEKHVPEYVVENNIDKVQIGAVEHPMIEAHYIQFVALETNQGYQIKHLHANEKPVVHFALAEGEEVVAVYEYCNLHGLWKK